MQRLHKIVLLTLVLVGVTCWLVGGEWVFRLVCPLMLLALLFAMTRMLAFYLASAPATGFVTAMHIREHPDLDGYTNAQYWFSIRYIVDGKSFEAHEIRDIVEHDVGSPINIRYRCSAPQDVMADWWSGLWVTSIGTAIAAAMTWLAFKP